MGKTRSQIGPEPTGAAGKLEMINFRLVVLSLLVALASPALAASSSKDWKDCTAEDPDTGIAGCTRLLDRTQLSVAIARRPITIAVSPTAIISLQLWTAIADFERAPCASRANTITRRAARLTPERAPMIRPWRDFAEALRLRPDSLRPPISALRRYLRRQGRPRPRHRRLRQVLEPRARGRRWPQ